GIREALEDPRDYPPLRQVVVPGDRVVIAVDPTIPEAKLVLETVLDILTTSGVQAGDSTVLIPSNGSGRWEAGSLGTTSLVVHAPDDRSQLAYLASTQQGRRIYLNRLLTDADVVLPVGRVGFDPILGHRGPWSLLFPELSDRETMTAYRSRWSSP